MTDDTDTDRDENPLLDAWDDLKGRGAPPLEPGVILYAGMGVHHPCSAQFLRVVRRAGGDHPEGAWVLITENGDTVTVPHDRVIENVLAGYWQPIRHPAGLFSLMTAGENAMFGDRVNQKGASASLSTD